MTADPCVFTTPRGQCKRAGTAVVAGVDKLLCTQHARIVATTPGQSGVIRRPPNGPDEILAELRAATTQADFDRARGAIARQIEACREHGYLRADLVTALQEARHRIHEGAQDGHF